ncbi:hypothetical protein ACFYOK_22525 [Microbispora bryophytorum]|uniref:hypothetical protein n=1 Tax=Microbispora bryophytorum TaxID=1460882 RepID=UPI0033C5D9E3
MNDLYERDLAGARFRRLCGGSQQEQEQETRVEIAPIPGAADAFALRDSKDPNAGNRHPVAASTRPGAAPAR